MNLPNDQDATLLVQAVLKTLAGLFDDSVVEVDQSVSNAARVAKIPGTMARKGHSMPDRPHRRSRVIEAPADAEAVVKREQMVALVAENSVAASRERPTPAPGAELFDIERFIAQHLTLKRGPEPYSGGGGRWIVQCPFDGEHAGTSAAVLQMPSGANAFKCQHNSCRDRRWEDVRELYESGYRDRWKTQEPSSTNGKAHFDSRSSEQTKNNGKSPKRLNLRDLREIKFERVTWFETNMIPRAELTLVNGDGGIGKTTGVCDLVARSSAGLPMPSGLQHDRPMKWLIVAEEDRHGLLRARLDVAGANHDNIRLVESVGAEQDFLTFPSHAKALHDTVLEGEWDGVLIDALLSHLDDDVNASKPQEMRRALRPITDIAHATGATVVAIRHLGKGNGPASQRGLGSIEARNLCRSELTVGPHPDEDAHPELFMIALSKANLSPDRKATMAYRLASADVNDDDGLPTTIARVHWAAAPPSISADDLLDRQEPAERGKFDAAADWLRAELSNGERRATELCDAAVKAGHTRPTVYRAKVKLPIRAVQRGFPAQSYWCLKEPGVSQVSHVSQHSIHEKRETADATGSGVSVESHHETLRQQRHQWNTSEFETPGRDRPALGPLKRVPRAASRSG